MYVTKSIQKGRLVFYEDVSKEKLKASMMYDIKAGAVSVNTTLVKSVGGIPKPGDRVQVKIIRQNNQTREIEVLSYSELEAIKLISIQTQTGDKVQPDNEQNKNSVLAGNDGIKPAIATFAAIESAPDRLIQILDNNLSSWHCLKLYDLFLREYDKASLTSPITIINKDEGLLHSGMVQKMQKSLKVLSPAQERTFIIPYNKRIINASNEGGTFISGSIQKL